MLVILWISNTERIARFTGLCAGALVALYITFEAPLSGMSMNPARSFASAAAGGSWRHAWIYYIAPLLGMLTAVELHHLLRGHQAVKCAKLDHPTHVRCIHCGYEPPPLQSHPKVSELSVGRRRDAPGGLIYDYSGTARVPEEGECVRGDSKTPRG